MMMVVPEAAAVADSGCSLYPELAGRISLLESSRVTAGAIEAEEMLALANSRHALAMFRVKELEGELLKVSW